MASQRKKPETWRTTDELTGDQRDDSHHNGDSTTAANTFGRRRVGRAAPKTVVA
jgi:hypothetical protein